MSTADDAVQAAHAELRAMVRKKRKAFKQEFGKLATALGEVMALWDEWREASVRPVDPVPMPPLSERVKGLELVLRDVWMKGREQPWRYRCDRCEDTGWAFHACTAEAPCGRPFKLPNQRHDDYTGRGHCVDGHTYVRPCFCERGQSIGRVLEAPAKPRPEDFKDAARSKFTKLGR